MEGRLKVKGDPPLPEKEVPMHLGWKNHHFYVPAFFILAWSVVGTFAALGRAELLFRQSIGVERPDNNALHLPSGAGKLDAARR